MTVTTMLPSAETVSSVCLAAFFAALLLPPLSARILNMMLPRRARSHRLLGGALLLWLAVGLVDVIFDHLIFTHRYIYDIILGALGVFTTYSAATTFHHGSHTKSSGKSGTLEVSKTVTVSEMKEHLFYQILNVLQVTYLHAVGSASLYVRLTLCVLMATPWLFRRRFPVNSFSSNWSDGEMSIESILYRIKKYQYMFYKHALLHGLNISVALAGGSDLAETQIFRMYWIALNTSYVMEFFLQTMVRRKRLSQQTMLRLQQILMLGASVSAMHVCWSSVRFDVALLSLLANLVHRGADTFNVCCVMALILLVDHVRASV